MPKQILEQFRFTEFEVGSGDYSTNRHKISPQKTVQELGEELKTLRAKITKNKKTRL